MIDWAIDMGYHLEGKCCLDGEPLVERELPLGRVGFYDEKGYFTHQGTRLRSTNYEDWYPRTYAHRATKADFESVIQKETVFWGVVGFESTGYNVPFDLLGSRLRVLFPIIDDDD